MFVLATHRMPIDRSNASMSSGVWSSYRQLSQGLQGRPLCLIHPSTELISNGWWREVTSALAQGLILLHTNPLLLCKGLDKSVAATAREGCIDAD